MVDQRIRDLTMVSQEDGTPPYRGTLRYYVMVCKEHKSTHYEPCRRKGYQYSVRTIYVRELSIMCRLLMVVSGMSLDTAPVT